MRLRDPNVVDFVGIEKVTGRIRLTLADDFDGDDQLERLYLLQEKLKRYCDFIRSGEAYSTASQQFGRKVASTTAVRIDVIAKQELVVERERFLEYARGLASDVGAEFTFRAISPG